MKHEFDPEFEIENKLGRICGAVFEAICSTLSEEQDRAARDLLRRVVANPNVYRHDKRVLAIIAGATDEELDQLVTELYGNRPREFTRSHLRVVGGNDAA
jgi:hypothetical protein